MAQRIKATISITITDSKSGEVTYSLTNAPTAVQTQIKKALQLWGVPQ